MTNTKRKLEKSKVEIEEYLTSGGRDQLLPTGQNFLLPEGKEKGRKGREGKRRDKK